MDLEEPIVSEKSESEKIEVPVAVAEVAAEEEKQTEEVQDHQHIESTENVVEETKTIEQIEDEKLKEVARETTAHIVDQIVEEDRLELARLSSLVEENGNSAGQPNADDSLPVDNSQTSVIQNQTESESEDRVQTGESIIAPESMNNAQEDTNDEHDETRDENEQDKEENPETLDQMSQESKAVSNGEPADTGDSEPLPQVTEDAVADVIAAVELSLTTKPATVRKNKPHRANKTPTTPTANTSSMKAIDMDSMDIGSPSGLQKRRKKDPSAPKAPLNGYLVYFNKERNEMHQRNPHITFGDLTKIIANKWKELPTEEKQRYTNEALMDKERYAKEMADYKRTDSHKDFMKDVDMNRAGMNGQTSGGHFGSNPEANNLSGGPNLTWLQTENNVAGFDVPIFTEEFIEHSKSREQELRLLRKEIAELEQQNSVLTKHIDSLKHSNKKSESDCNQMRHINQQLQTNMDSFRQTVLNLLHSVPLPNTQPDFYPSQANIDEYIARLWHILNQVETASNDPASQMNRNFVQHVRTVFSQVNFQSLFE